MFEKITSTIKGFLGDNHEVTESMKEALKDRLTSPFYGYFVISWFIVNWDFFYTALFVDGDNIYEKTGLLKNEYLFQVILPTHYKFPEYWWTFIILPLILTFVAFWPMQFLTRLFYKKHIDNKKADERIKSDALAAKVEAETKILKAEVAQAKIEKEASEISPELVWRKEYTDFENHPLFNEFNKIIDSIYSYGGRISVHEFDSQIDSWVNFDVPQDILVYADVNELISKKGNVISLTPKGKIFVKLYANKKQEAPF